MTPEKRLGFGALYGCGVAPFEVAQWARIDLDPDAGAEGGSKPPVTGVEALIRLDKLSAELTWTSDHDLRLLIKDQYLAFVVALDQTNKSVRLRAAIARAYAEADLLAQAFVAEKQDLEKARSLAMKFADAQSGLVLVDRIFHAFVVGVL